MRVPLSRRRCSNDATGTDFIARIRGAPAVSKACRRNQHGTTSALANRVVDIFSGLQPLHSALDYHLERHNVLSTNIAHVDTPGFRPNDLARVEATDFASILSVQMERTAPGHLVSSQDLSGNRAGRVFEDSTAGAGNDGNYVSLDRETAKLAANHLRYDVVSALAASELKGLMYAVSDGKG